MNKLALKMMSCLSHDIPIDPAAIKTCSVPSERRPFPVLWFEASPIVEFAL
jgi:hypothetical protein